MTRIRILVLVTLLALAPLVVASPEEGAAPVDCPAGLREMEGTGTVCPRESGLYEVFRSDLTSIGFTHGQDPVPPVETAVAAPAAAGIAPKCVDGAPGTYYIQVIYARAHDDTDQFAAWLPVIRRLVNESNALVNDAAIATGSTSALNVKCVNGLVDVRNEALPTAKASAQFSTIAGDLLDRGYSDGRVKYWILYDDTGACTCGGQGHIYGDSRPHASNANNGNAGPMFAITYGYDSTRIWLHELGHNLGAVQLDAPHTSGGWHCNDGRDIMCYNDGGSNSSGYSNAYCSAEVWDCGKDSYFNAMPAPGSYLASHWNVGSSVNRFLSFGTPALLALTCSPLKVELGNATTCTFHGVDDSGSVRYRVDWGDGTTEHVPSSTTFAPSGAERSASHVWSSTGDFTITVSISDASGLVGNALSRAVEVKVDFTPPSITRIAPAPRTIYHGCDVAVPSPANLPRPVWIGTACVKVDAQDTGSGVDRVEVFVGGILRGVDTTAPYEFEFPVPNPQLNVPVFVYAYDVARNRGYEAFTVDMIGTV